MKKNIILYLLLIIILINAVIQIIPTKTKVTILSFEDENFKVNPFLFYHSGQIDSPTINIKNDELLDKKYEFNLCIDNNCYLLQKGDKLSKEHNLSGYNKKLTKKDIYYIENNAFIKIIIGDNNYNLKLERP